MHQPLEGTFTAVAAEGDEPSCEIVAMFADAFSGSTGFMINESRLTFIGEAGETVGFSARSLGQPELAASSRRRGELPVERGEWRTDHLGYCDVDRVEDGGVLSKFPRPIGDGLVGDQHHRQRHKVPMSQGCDICRDASGGGEPSQHVCRLEGHQFRCMEGPLEEEPLGPAAFRPLVDQRRNDE